MGGTSFQVTSRLSPTGELMLAAEGYLDEEGGSALAREICAAGVADRRLVCIDLGAVYLFNCLGARQLISFLHEAKQLGCQVVLVGVRSPLQRFLDLAV